MESPKSIMASRYLAAISCEYERARLLDLHARRGKQVSYRYLDLTEPAGKDRELRKGAVRVLTHLLCLQCSPPPCRAEQAASMAASSSPLVLPSFLRSHRILLHLQPQRQRTKLFLRQPTLSPPRHRLPKQPHPMQVQDLVSPQPVSSSATAPLAI